jgi:hypothetical protein
VVASNIAPALPRGRRHGLASDIEEGLDGVRGRINEIVPQKKLADIFGFRIDIDRFVVGLERIMWHDVMLGVMRHGPTELQR